MFSTTTAKLRVFISIGLLWLIGITCASQAADAPSVLILGDSLSAGYGIELNDAWPSLLQSRLTESQLPHRVENASISGETTRGGVRRLPKLLAQYRPKVVIVELGANDGLRGIPISEVERNLQRIIELNEDNGARSLLLEMKVPPNYGATYAEQFEAMFERLAESENVSFVPFFLDGVVLNRDLMQNDGLHPTAKAQPILLDNVWDYIRDAIE